MNPDPQQPNLWKCLVCGETNSGYFHNCWNEQSHPQQPRYVERDEIIPEDAFLKTSRTHEFPCPKRLIGKRAKNERMLFTRTPKPAPVCPRCGKPQTEPVHTCSPVEHEGDFDANAAAKEMEKFEFPISGNKPVEQPTQSRRHWICPVCGEQNLTKYTCCWNYAKHPHAEQPQPTQESIKNMTREMVEKHPEAFEDLADQPVEQPGEGDGRSEMEKLEDEFAAYSKKLTPQPADSPGGEDEYHDFIEWAEVDGDSFIVGSDGRIGLSTEFTDKLRSMFVPKEAYDRWTDQLIRERIELSRAQEALTKYIGFVDAIYNFNEAARAAVIKIVGISHVKHLDDLYAALKPKQEEGKEG